jgi:hypothetical protein
MTGTPGDEFDDGMLRLIRTVKDVLTVLAYVSTGLLALYASYLVLGSIFFLIHAVVR